VTDSELVAAALGGEADAYGALMDRHQVAVARVCRGLVGPGPDSDEIAHDALVDGYLQLDRLRSPERFGAWIRTIALNRSRRWLRDHARLSPLTARAADELVAPENVETRSDCVAQAMFGLRPQQRLMLILHYWERLPYAEIAEFLDVPVGTVMSRLSRARTGLKRIMEMDTDAMAPGSVLDMRREVDAEIRMMLSLVEKDRALRGRLAVLLSRSPARLEYLTLGLDNVSARDVALLLPRLGPAAMDRMLGWCWGPDADLRAGARRVLAALAGIPGHVADRAAMSRVASKGLYLLVDRALASNADRSAVAELLLDLLGPATKDERAALLLSNAILACGDTALTSVTARLAPIADAAGMFRAGDVLYVACRFGTRFGAIVLSSLAGEGPMARAPAVAAVRDGPAGAHGGRGASRRAHRHRGHPRPRRPRGPGSGRPARGDVGNGLEGHPDRGGASPRRAARRLADAAS
jgi:RNA polymerase sigma-70 factor (ECF subfamily)